MRSRTRTALCVAILIVCLATPVLCTKKRKSLSDVDLAALEKEWEAGDDAAELEREYEHQMKIGKQKATPQTPFDSSNPDEWLRQNPTAMSGTGAQLMFAELTQTQPDGAEWTKDDVDRVGAQWKELLMTGGVNAMTYNIGMVGSVPAKHNKHVQQILVSLDKGWQTQDTIEFLVAQPEVNMVTWNSQKYLGKRSSKSSEL